MKPVLAIASFGGLLLAVACSQSPEKLLSEANKYHDNKKYEEASILYQKILVKDKTNAEAYYRLGLNSLDQGKVREAVPALQRAVDLKPTNTDAVSKLAQLYIAGYAQDPKNGKRLLPDIEKLDGKLLQQNPNSYEGLRIQGLKSAIVDHDLAKAEDSFAKANNIKPYTPELVEHYSEVLIDEKKLDQAVTLLNETLARNKTWDKGYGILLIIYSQTHQNDKLVATLQQHLDADPKSVSAIVNFARYKEHANDFAGAEQLMLRMAKDPKTFPSGQMLLGDFYARSGKLDQAKAAFEQGKKDDPKNAIYYDGNLVKLQIADKHIPEAIASAKTLADQNPKDLSATALYADLLLSTNTRDKSTKTIDEIKKMVDNNPSNTVLRLDLGKAYFEMGDREKSLAALIQVVTDAQKDQQKTSRLQPALAPAETLEARIYSERGDQLKAQALTEAVLGSGLQGANRETVLDARIIHARALIATNKAAEAQPEIEALLKQEPNLVEAHLLLADAYLAQRQFDKASQEYTTACKGTTPNPRGLIGLQTVKLLSGHPAEAVQGIQDLLSKNPGDAVLRFELAKFQTSAATMPPNVNQPSGQQLLQQAEDNYKQIIAANPTVKDDLWMRLGAVQHLLGQNEAALASYEQATSLNPQNPAAFLEHALLLETSNHRKEAIEDYNKVLNIAPENALALNNLAMISAENGTNLDQAQTYAERAKKGAPNSPDVADTLGYVYMQKNLNTQAAEIFRENVQKFPQVPAFRFHLAMALLKQGDKQGAKDQATKALSNAPPDLQNKIKAFVGQIG